MSAEIRTKALVLRRTNYGETDRILSILTPEGKMAVLAKGARKAKSKLAGGIEMFSLSEVVLHQGKGEFAVLTAAKMQEFYQELLTDLERLEAASEILKRVAKAAEHFNSTEHFAITVQALRALNRGASIELTLAWFYFNLARIGGEQVNLYTDTAGEKLREDLRYVWDAQEKALAVAGSVAGAGSGPGSGPVSGAGKIGADEIKMMRLMLSAELNLVLSVKGASVMAAELLYIAKSLNQV